MKKVIIFVFCFACVLCGIFWFTDNTIDCAKIPQEQMYKYAKLSGQTNKCVMLSETEIKENLLDEQEENYIDEKYKDSKEVKELY